MICLYYLEEEEEMWVILDGAVGCVVKEGFR